jgi:hypothetical protein
MQTEYEEFLDQVSICHRFARRAVTPELKAAWMRLGDSWLAKIPRDHFRDAIPFDGAYEADANSVWR